MKKILQLTTDDGGTLFIEVSDVIPNEQIRGTSNDTRGIIENTKESFDKAIKPLKEVLIYN